MTIVAIYKIRFVLYGTCNFIIAAIMICVRRKMSWTLNFSRWPIELTKKLGKSFSLAYRLWCVNMLCLEGAFFIV